LILASQREVRRRVAFGAVVKPLQRQVAAAIHRARDRESSGPPALNIASEESREHSRRVEACSTVDASFGTSGLITNVQCVIARFAQEGCSSRWVTSKELTLRQPRRHLSRVERIRCEVARSHEL